MMKKHFVFILVIALVLMLPSCSKDKELTQKVESLEEAVKTLSTENNTLKKQISELESRADSIEDSLSFEVSEYPIRYELTEQSYADFKADFIELTKKQAALYGATEDELKEALAMIEALDGDSLVEEFFYFNSEEGIYVELLDENKLYADGYEEYYLIKEGRLYIDGDECALIDDDAITLVSNDDKIEFTLKMYRTTPKTGSKITLAEKMDKIESKLNEVYYEYFY